jgi:hypothetical protein
MTPISNPHFILPMRLESDIRYAQDTQCRLQLLSEWVMPDIARIIFEYEREPICTFMVQTDLGFVICEYPVYEFPFTGFSSWPIPIAAIGTPVDVNVIYHAPGDRLDIFLTYKAIQHNVSVGLFGYRPKGINVDFQWPLGGYLRSARTLAQRKYVHAIVRIGGGQMISMIMSNGRDVRLLDATGQCVRRLTIDPGILASFMAAGDFHDALHVAIDDTFPELRPGDAFTRQLRLMCDGGTE